MKNKRFEIGTPPKTESPLFKKFASGEAASTPRKEIARKAPKGINNRAKARKTKENKSEPEHSSNVTQPIVVQQSADDLQSDDSVRIYVTLGIPMSLKSAVDKIAEATNTDADYVREAASKQVLEALRNRLELPPFVPRSDNPLVGPTKKLQVRFFVKKIEQFQQQYDPLKMMSNADIGNAIAAGEMEIAMTRFADDLGIRL